MKAFALVALVALCSLSSGAQAKDKDKDRDGDKEKAAPPTAYSPKYRIVDAGLIIERSIDERPGMNAATDIAAWTTIQRSSSQADLRHLGQAERMLEGLPKDSNSFALGINSSGVVVGTVESGSDMRFTQAFSWKDGTVRMLPTLGGEHALARSINDSGLIVGAAQTNSKYYHATRWEKEVAKELATLPGGDTSYANDINRSGEVAGMSNDTPNGQGRAVRWSADGTVHPLPVDADSVFSSAVSMNNKGQAVGFDNAEAVLWTGDREVELGTFGDEPNAALDVNDNGDVVGTSAEDEGRMRAFLWKNGEFLNLNQLIPAKSGWVLLSAFRITDRGEILVHGFYQGKSRLCLLVPNAEK